MKTNILFIVGLLLSSTAIAQEVKVTNSDIVEKNGTVTVRFRADVLKLKSNQRLTITPVVYRDSSAQSLPPIILTGRNRSLSERRMRLDRSNTLRARKGMQIPYTVNFPYQSWMGDLSLRIDRKVEGCCDEQIEPSLELVDCKSIRYDVVLAPIKPITPELSPTEKLDLESSFLYPIKEYDALKKNRDILRAEGALRIHFKQGSTAINPTFGENKKTLDKIKEILTIIESDPQATLEKIVLAGASSPEGSLQKNDRLSQKRADALKDHLGINISPKGDFFEVVTVGEDWVGLRQMVEESTMEYRDLVLATIDKYSVKQGREVELMKLKWGRPYNYLLEHFFPKLRSAGYIRLFYESKPSPEFEATNQAIELYNQHSYTDVLTRTQKITPTAVTETIRGGCYMMLGNDEAAERTLQNAIRLGSSEAVKLLKDLHQLQKVKRDNPVEVK